MDGPLVPSTPLAPKKGLRAASRPFWGFDDASRHAVTRLSGRGTSVRFEAPAGHRTGNNEKADFVGPWRIR